MVKSKIQPTDNKEMFYLFISIRTFCRTDMIVTILNAIKAM